MELSPDIYWVIFGIIIFCIFTKLIVNCVILRFKRGLRARKDLENS